MKSTKLKDVIKVLEEYAPLPLQETYDNAGLIVGDREKTVTKILICIDSTEEVLDEAIQKGCNLIVAHHPIVFSGLKKFTGTDYIQRIIIKAIKNDIAIYASHTNLDNVHNGVNAKICEKLGIHQKKVLVSKKDLLKKLVVYCPQSHEGELKSALFAAGAGKIGEYDECSFNMKGTGTFRPSVNASPYSGEAGKRSEEAEIRIEVIFPYYIERKVISAMLQSHPYEEVAHDIVPIDNNHQLIGSGMIGMLEVPMDEKEFLVKVKKALKAGSVRYTKLRNKKIEKVAVCGGSGSFLLNAAIAAEADIFITSDFKYHQFFDADGKILIADVGHFESEQFTTEIFYDLLKKNFPTFAVCLTETNTNPINYL